MMNAKELINTYGLHPNKSLGQNFLIDNAACSQIAALCHCEGNPVLEIGPGLGALTKELVETASEVFAVEIDENMVKILSEQLSSCTNLRVIHADFIKYPLSLLASALDGKPCIVAGNLPYYITSSICQKLLGTEINIPRMVLMVQEEAAERFLASPGDKNYVPLSVAAQQKYTVSIAHRLSPSSYYPSPEVNSCVLLFERNANEPIPNFYRIVKAAFAMRRKTLYNNMQTLLNKRASAAVIEYASLNPAVRAETLTIEQFSALTKAYNSFIEAKGEDEARAD